ncbi:hypothetical protein D3C76_1350240 [compost metagenome]
MSCTSCRLMVGAAGPAGAPPWAMCSAWPPDIGIGVFSMAHGTVWRVALLRLRASTSDWGTLSHIAAGNTFQTAAYCLPQNPVQVMPLSSITSNNEAPQKPMTACRSRHNTRPRLLRRGQRMPAA